MARPPFKPTAAQKRRVAILAGAGTSHEQIALTIGISRTTLLKHFEFELSIGAYQKRAEVIEAMHAAAKKGNVAAQKAYAAFADPPAAAPPQQPADPKEPPLGKKEQANAEARTAQAGTEWADLLKSPAALQ